jgi:hypothetical protein
MSNLEHDVESSNSHSWHSLPVLWVQPAVWPCALQVPPNAHAEDEKKAIWVHIPAVTARAPPAPTIIVAARAVAALEELCSIKTAKGKANIR